MKKEIRQELLSIMSLLIVIIVFIFIIINKSHAIKDLEKEFNAYKLEQQYQYNTQKKLYLEDKLEYIENLDNSQYWRELREMYRKDKDLIIEEYKEVSNWFDDYYELERRKCK